jgi:hypothetical protein
MNPEELFNEWFKTDGERYWNPNGHVAYLKRAFMSGVDTYNDKIRLQEESLGNWKMVSDKAMAALRNVDSRAKWQAEELYEWAKSRDIEIEQENQS